MTPNELVVAGMGEAKRIAHRAYKQVPGGATTQFDDLLGAAYLGLVKASKQYDVGAGKPFMAFAQFRARGEIRDYQRTIDIRSRRDVEQGVQPPCIFMYEEEDETFGAAGDGDALCRLRLYAALNGLPPRTLRMLQLRFGEDLTLEDIGAIYNVTQSRACQVINSALRVLREVLQ